ncbi:hypothetical protein BCL57_002943 [Agromyces flavus]|uniref:Uncharacterized protein n=1 Tax=Agromyces flavus TaxID=589382 RepID=A0A1H1MEP1_9MICO|nr:hypothetical protein [Agromyces flavus]MCP2368767.1 hypothetical protein [Agromyces flavus]GGI47995.1 hypothetical protein GCM10010932_26830 [Agromyces flavus]SDR85176.1 hypothetical protein SAMN04489721_0400 [Agromyces flavus]
MKRVNILYDGLQYSVGHADLEAIKATIEQAHATGTARWITVNFGEGRPQPADLLVGPGIPISVIPIPPDDDLGGTDDASESERVVAEDLG